MDGIERHGVRFIGEMIHSLTSPCAQPSTAQEWHCIAAWAVVGWRVAREPAIADGALVDLIGDALTALDGGVETSGRTGHAG